MSIVEFLLARIADDETIALDWRHQDSRHPGEGKVTIYGGGLGYLRLLNPDRILAECEAKRRIADLHAVTWRDESCTYCGGADSERLGCTPADHGHWQCAACGDLGGRRGEPQPACATLRAIAGIYAEHPDYDEAWAA